MRSLDSSLIKTHLCNIYRSFSLFFFFTLLLCSFWTSRSHRCRHFSPPVLGFNFLSRIVVLFRLCNNSYLLRVVLPVQQECRCLFLFSTIRCSSGNCSLSFLIRSSCITFLRTPVVCFALYSFFIAFFLLFLFYFSFFSHFLWSG